MDISYQKDGVTTTVDFDGHEREVHDSKATVTEHPVEVGVDITDHIRPEADTVTIDVIVTNSPIRVPKSLLDGATGGVRSLELEIPTRAELPVSVPIVGALLAGSGLLDGTKTEWASTLQFSKSFNRAKNAYDVMRTLVGTATLIKISTVLRDYEDMAITSVTAPKTAQDGDGLFFSFSARKVRFAVTSQVPVPAATTQPITKKNLGPKPTVEPPKESLLHKGVGAIGRFLGR